jgi:hypothetical protein
LAHFLCRRHAQFLRLLQHSNDYAVMR